MRKLPGSDGVLVERYVEYFIYSLDANGEVNRNGDVEFWGGINVLKFSASEMQKNFTIKAKADGVPEVGNCSAKIQICST